MSMNRQQKFVVEVTLHDMNKRLEELIKQYKFSGNESYLNNANAIKSEFFECWNEELSRFG